MCGVWCLARAYPVPVPRYPSLMTDHCLSLLDSLAESRFNVEFVIEVCEAGGSAGVNMNVLNIRVDKIVCKFEYMNFC